tara:strand:- start:2395 stop:3372 length:978 start_codon:yes stop_codon:yes gene_type:complete
MDSEFSAKNIETIILKNYGEYLDLFMPFQSEFFSGLYNRYQSIENGNLVLFFAKKVHQNILRQKDYNLNFNVSFEKFWENHSLVEVQRNSIISISKELSIPKETTRRRILELMQQKILNKKNKSIGWAPNEQYKKSYNIFVQKEINDLTKLITFICKKINLFITSEELKKEIEEKFSFYWYHYLGIQLKYLKIWGRQFKDIELAFIFMQVVAIFADKIKNNELSHKLLWGSPSVIKNFERISISATSVAEITGIPRATCVRKLEILTNLKMILQDKISKRYYLSSEVLLSNVANKSTSANIIKIYSEFYFIIVRALNSKLDSNKS